MKQEADKNGFVDRRKGKDSIAKAITIFSVISWLLFISVIAVFVLAEPKINDNFIIRVLKLNPTYTGWNYTYLKLAFFLIVITIIVCLTGIFLNMARHKRRSDRLSKSFVFFSLICIVSCIGFIVFFGFPR